MDSKTNCESSQQIKEEFKVWLKKFHEQLSNKNQTLKSDLDAKEKINNELRHKIETFSNNSVTTSTLAIDVIPNNVQIQLEEGVNNLKIKLDQLSKCNESINAQVEEETKKLHNKLYDMIIKDDIALKPYHDVEEAINGLTHNTDLCMRKINEDKETFLELLKAREICYTEIKQDIAKFESIVTEMRLSIQNSKKDLEGKLKLLKLHSTEEATSESIESKELLLCISDMKSQLKIQ